MTRLDDGCSAARAGSLQAAVTRLSGHLARRISLVYAADGKRRLTLAFEIMTARREIAPVGTIALLIM